MKFVWDETKASTNHKKHRVSFEEAQTVFEDSEALRIYDPDHSEEEEERFLLLGLKFESPYASRLPLLPRE